MKKLLVPTGNDVLDKFWNVYNSQKVSGQKLNKKRGNNTKRIILYGGNNQMISRKASRMVKENFPEN